MGGVDHIFASCAAEVLSARNLGSGGSDHDALDVTMRLFNREPYGNIEI